MNFQTVISLSNGKSNGKKKESNIEWIAYMVPLSMNLGQFYLLYVHMFLEI